MFVDAEDEDVVVKLGFEHQKPALAEVALGGVVVAAFLVVVVGDHDHGKADGSEQVQPVGPVRIKARLVDLVHGNGLAPERERSGRREHDSAPGPELFGDGVRYRGVFPLAQYECGTSRPGEQPVGRPNPGNCRLDRHHVAMVGSWQAGDNDLSADGVTEVFGGLDGQVVNVFLKAEWRVEQHCIDVAARGLGETFEHPAVRHRHGWRCFARTHEDEQARELWRGRWQWSGHVVIQLGSVAARCNSPATSLGCWACTS